MHNSFLKASLVFCCIISLLFPAIEKKLHVRMALSTPQIKGKQCFYDAFNLYPNNMFTCQIIMQYSSRPI